MEYPKIRLIALLLGFGYMTLTLSTLISAWMDENKEVIVYIDRYGEGLFEIIVCPLLCIFVLWVILKEIERMKL